MAMTLRTSETDEALLGRLATRWGISRQQAVLRAIREAETRESGVEQVLRITETILTEDAEALEKLADL